VFHCVQVPVGIVTEDGKVQMTNPALDRFLGYPPGSLIGKSSIDFIVPTAHAGIKIARQKQLENGQDYSMPTTMLRSDGTGIAVDLTSVMVRRDDLKRFRIITVQARTDALPPVTVHVAGRIKLVGLQEVKTALGTRWAAAAARAMTSAEHVIRQRCGPTDTFSRTADGDFLICFGDATEDEAAFRAATMARAIRIRLIGEGETESTAQVSAIAAAVAVPDEPGRSADMLGTMINERLSGRLAEIETRARETLRGAALAATCELETVRGRRSDVPVALYAQLPQGHAQCIQAACCALPSAERDAFDFDRLVLGVAAEQVITDLAVGRSTLVLVNVDFDVFLDRRCMERYVAACQALDPRLRERLILVLAGMPRSCPQSRVLECVTRLRPFCRGMGLQSETLEVPTVDLSIFGSPIVVLRADCLGSRNARDMTMLTKLVVNLHSRKARVLVRWTDNWDDAKTMLREFGADLVTVRPTGRRTEPSISLETRRQV
jgi:PAS domain S-box-containing protein